MPGMSFSTGYKRKGATSTASRSTRPFIEHQDDIDEEEIARLIIPAHISGQDQEYIESSPKTFMDKMTSPRVQIGLSFFGLVGLPCWLVYGRVPGSSPLGFYNSLINVWDSFLHISIYLVGSVTVLVACLHLYVENCCRASSLSSSSSSSTISLKKSKREFDWTSKAWKIIGTPMRLSILTLALFVYLSSTSSIQTIVNPSWSCAPFLLLSNYRVVWPSQLKQAMNGICIDYRIGQTTDPPLCLSEDSWKTLSAGALSSKKTQDVEAVVAGIEFAARDTSGLVVNVLARDVADHVEQLQQNVEALSTFFPNKLAVVIFENDSKDGSRELFQGWASRPINKGYKVDLMSCPEAEDCKLKKEHRYDGEKEEDFFTSPSVGSMHIYRQRMLDYIISNPEYDNFSHMLQIDLDIGVSLSPLGVLHSIGKSRDDYAVASSCRQAWAGGLGTVVPPYDFNAFQPLPTKENERLFQLHETFCGLMPPNDKWRFNCVGASAVQFLQIIQLDRANRNMDSLYPVASAYNGATLYPLQLIRKNNPKYDSGEFGHRCEHVGFNLALDKQMYINPKWDCHLSPTLPGGPRGERAMKSVKRFASIPHVAIPLFLQTFLPLVICIFSIMALSIQSLKPLFVQP